MSSADVNKTALQGGAYAENMAYLALLGAENAMGGTSSTNSQLPDFTDGYDQLDGPTN